MTSITYRTGVIAEGQARLLFQFRKRGNFKEFLRPLLRQIQDLETAFYNLIAGRQLPTATGWALDQLGQSVGEYRAKFAPDSSYRGLIYARIAVNTSSGTATDVWSITRLVGGQNVRVRDVYPAAAIVSFSGEILITGEQLRQALELATAPIGLDIVQSPETDYFSLAGDPDGLGFGLGALSAAY